MAAVDLKGNPFYLDERQISWVEETLSSMTLEEKIGQLFIMLDRTKDREEERRIIEDFHIGGCRYINEPARNIWEQNRFYQECAKIPLLIACNCDSGGDGCCSDGTYVATAAASGASPESAVLKNDLAFRIRGLSGMASSVGSRITAGNGITAGDSTSDGAVLPVENEITAENGTSSETASEEKTPSSEDENRFAGFASVAEMTGYVSGREAEAVGCNWNFGPICDIKLNWRNTIINTRAYSGETFRVMKNCMDYIKGMRRSSSLAVTAKHFPGDGVDELDQHLAMSINSLSAQEWMDTYGRVYDAMIREGTEAVMVGHIALPSYEKIYNPGVRNEDILPATLSPVLIRNLLREKLGFNGLVVTDASHMAGMTCAMPRRLQVPTAIAAGCDMFLFFNDIEEDFNYMLEGYKEGILTEERLNEAVTRILALKAHLSLPEKQAFQTLVPMESDLGIIGAEEHKNLADEAARRSITLVKDTKKQLPVTPGTHKRAYVLVISESPMLRDGHPDPAKEMIRREMEAFGYEVTMHDSYYDLVMGETEESRRGMTPDAAENLQTFRFTKEARLKSVRIGNVAAFKDQYDCVFVFINMGSYAQCNNVRLTWSTGLSREVPWYVQEVPTYFISLNYTYHLHDLPMAKTYINAYAPTENVVRHVLRKMAGEEPFEGHFEDSVFCDRWEARL